MQNWDARLTCGNPQQERGRETVESEHVGGLAGTAMSHAQGTHNTGP